ncbi:MAG: MBL fold metallo-hydrolase [candidate division WOR-3 bacterium]|nr:MBL fold metallo-hydrolase [candidate division WOR-3 bacterium]
MKIIPIAFDSLGTRSMATYIETGDIKIIIDPSVRLSPLRYNLPPHPIEQKRKDEHWQEIVKYARNADIMIVTHYHYDHHNPESAELYQDKICIIKHPLENINYNQKQRASVFLEKIKPLARKIEIGDGQSFNFNGVLIKCSPAVYHGANDYTGYVFETLIADEKERLIFTSDVCGIPDERQLNFILENNPDIIICDGPSLYLKGYRYSELAWHNSIANTARIINESKVKTFIIDHHLTRDLRYFNFFKEIKQKADSKVSDRVAIITAAEYLNKEIELLEAQRKELYRLLGNS